MYFPLIPSNSETKKLIDEANNFNIPGNKNRKGKGERRSEEQNNIQYRPLIGFSIATIALFVTKKIVSSYKKNHKLPFNHGTIALPSKMQNFSHYHSF
jgi:hypothetical protein